MQTVHQWEMHSLDQDMVGSWAVAQGNTSGAVEVCPHKVPIRERDPSELERYLEARQNMGRTTDDSALPNKCIFKMATIMHFQKKFT